MLYVDIEGAEICHYDKQNNVDWTLGFAQLKNFSLILEMLQVAN